MNVSTVMATVASALTQEEIESVASDALSICLVPITHPIRNITGIDTEETMINSGTPGRAESEFGM
jgi:hypothetical protein